MVSLRMSPLVTSTAKKKPRIPFAGMRGRFRDSLLSARWPASLGNGKEAYDSNNNGELDPNADRAEREGSIRGDNSGDAEGRLARCPGHARPCHMTQYVMERRCVASSERQVIFETSGATLRPSD